MKKGFLAVFGVPALVVSACFLVGCNTQGPASAPVAKSTAPDQATICEVSDWKAGVTASKCRIGQKIVFLPERWGNEQLPILFAAVNCDLRYSLAQTNGGVACIYVGPLAPEHPASPSSTQAQSSGG